MEDAATPPLPMSPTLANAHIGPTTLGDQRDEPMIVAATDDVNCTPSPQTTSVGRRLKRFTERITKRRPPPFLELSGDDTAIGRRAWPSLPNQSRRLTAQSIAHIPAAKRGEYLS